MGLSGLLNTGRQAIAAQSFGVAVTGQNVANVNTPGFSRREAQFSADPNGGVTVDGIRRASDIFTERRLFEATSLSSSASERDRLLQSTEALFNDLSGPSIGSTLDDVFTSFSNLSSTPNDTVARETVLERTKVFAGRVREIADSIAQDRTEQLSRSRDVIEQINTRAESLSTLNRQITIAEAQNADASDLRDQRNQVLLDLARDVNIRVTIGSNGSSLNVQAAGASLVEDGAFGTLSADLNTDGTMKIVMQRPGGDAVDITRLVNGGNLGALREVRDVDLVSVSQKLDTLAEDVATAVNTQHAAGFGLDGGTGRALFSITAGPGAARTLSVDAGIQDQPDLIAASESIAALPGGSGNAVELARLADAALSGGDTPGQAYADIVGDIGLRRNSAIQQADIQENVLVQVQNIRESFSGVSLDEEMVALTRFQRAFQAASKLISTADQLLEELLSRI